MVRKQRGGKGRGTIFNTKLGKYGFELSNTLRLDFSLPVSVKQRHTRLFWTRSSLSDYERAEVGQEGGNKYWNIGIFGHIHFNRTGFMYFFSTWQKKRHERLFCFHFFSNGQAEVSRRKGNHFIKDQKRWLHAFKQLRLNFLLHHTRKTVSRGALRIFMEQRSNEVEGEAVIRI